MSDAWPDDDFNAPGWHDNNVAVDPGGAAAGPGAIGPIPASLISNTTTDGAPPPEGAPAGTPGAASGAPFQINYAELEKFAQEHDLNAQELADWASGDPDFAEKYLATHGKVNFGTYLKIREFMASKQIAGTAFAEHNARTSTALRSSIASTKAQEEANARAIDATRMV
ncbi:type VII secretion target [Mycolicibacterium palauense]|uniref:type VII secretion target n=1 Tax=Mycolicibacterium palauense TaxID=2034511 RepID=UPI000BFF0017|nr:type VII secretion target [Mycolicibacterium palauense]